MRGRSIALACAAFVLVVLPLRAQAVNGQMLVSANWVQRHLGTMTLLHIGDAAGYGAGHIPDAVLIEMSSLLVQPNGTPNELPPIDALERVFRAAGVGTHERIVIYSNDPLLAARAWFTDTLEDVNGVATTIRKMAAAARDAAAPPRAEPRSTAQGPRRLVDVSH